MDLKNDTTPMFEDGLAQSDNTPLLSPPLSKATSPNKKDAYLPDEEKGPREATHQYLNNRMTFGRAEQQNFN